MGIIVLASFFLVVRCQCCPAASCKGSTQGNAWMQRWVVRKNASYTLPEEPSERSMPPTLQTEPRRNATTEDVDHSLVYVQLLDPADCTADSECGWHMRCGIDGACTPQKLGVNIGVDVAAGLISSSIAGISLVAGVGGGGLFVPMLMGLLSFDARTATSLSQSMLLGGALAAFLYNLGHHHPRSEQLPLVDFELACLLAPALMAGAQLGSIVHAVAPPIVLLVLLCVVLLDAARKGISSAVKLSNKEANSDVAPVTIGFAQGSYADANDVALLIQARTRVAQRRILVIWAFVIVVVLAKGLYTDMCSTFWWALTGAVVAALGCIAWDWSQHLRDQAPLHPEDLDFREVATPLLCWGSLAGLLAAVCGIGGGMVLGPILVKYQVPPPVSSATTATTLLLLASSTSLMYWCRSLAPEDYSTFLSMTTVIGAFAGKSFVGSWVRRTGRESAIVWCLVIVTVLSAILMGGIGLHRVWRTGAASMKLGHLCRHGDD